MKSFSIMNYVVLFFILICVGFLYKRFKEKLYYDDNNDNYNLIREYLLNDIDLKTSLIISKFPPIISLDSFKVCIHLVDILSYYNLMNI
jgi:hypothetical protein